MRTIKLVASDLLPLSLDEFRLKTLAWADGFPYAAYYNSNNIEYPHQGFEHFLAVTAQHPLSLPNTNTLEGLRQELSERNGFLCGYLSYDLKNQIEKLESQNPDNLNFPEILFFAPTIYISFSEKVLTINIEEFYEGDVIEEILDTKPPVAQTLEGVQLQQRVSKEKYISSVETIKEHILLGDVYELNYCMEFFSENIQLSPLPLYLELVNASPTPFSGYLKFGGSYLLCASPERFLKKEGSKLVSQPIKGTIRRGDSPEEDEALRLQLRNDEKELAENMMIVDLVRNDLSRSCAIGSVKVEEMFGTYGFRQVWQMISTVTGQLKPEKDLVDAITGAFPMGSMTGAPKISAMQLIEKLEDTKRGLFSGAFGYITPDQDCDFNVVIRSIQYNSNTGYLSFMVGSAITYDSVPEREYEECFLKARAIFNILNI